MGRKRDLSIFDAIEELDTQDRNAERKRRKETSVEKKKALEAQSQSKIYNHLLETRILLQRAVNKVNDAGTNTDAAPATFRETCDTLIENLLRARRQLSGASESKADKYKDLLLPSSAANLHNTLQDEYDTQRDDWKRILNRKHKSLRLHSGVTAKSQFRIMDSSFWEQVESTMEYEEIRKDETITKSVLFDDSKVYQQLLKDFVANSANSAGNTSMERPSTKKKSTSNKKQVDRRASKGRKIRYKEIPKLVNFTFPLSRPNTSSLNRDEYFQSLFGGAGVSSK
mmetsp:Transcript_1205/g.2736  ORF Transcript_1205/g.2736 Transcript_1205/m.2736 type:complete len:284 (-) Transcript_1205:229-1080(-)|eukprot:CAMPEP_0116088204 /NCGR_PEP_ID=MMETSP0327-20121206/5750_1 /TAXON_ID=44447 /ORGANISM="Pseudo-nitzschia delicatissima, Strain B596" /LENGTH=283 /DNA_ID=CAMNT_0003579279 /DNA_START=214 /DNA_END=1065 /DNA_ORIENTATION=-